MADVLHMLGKRCAPGTDLLDIDRWAGPSMHRAAARSCYADHVPSDVGRGPPTLLVERQSVQEARRGEQVGGEQAGHADLHRLTCSRGSPG